MPQHRPPSSALEADPADMPARAGAVTVPPASPVPPATAVPSATPVPPATAVTRMRWARPSKEQAGDTG
jgi:hypothetical protein